MYKGILFCGFIVLSACNPGQRASEPKPIAEGTKSNIDQNLLNGIIPSPQAVKENNVPVVDNICEKFIAKLPQDWFRERLEVPENPAEPNGRKIKIFYYGKIKPNTTPTIFFNGGPGASSHGSYRNLMPTKADYDSDNNISFVFIDQRGNGCSDFYPQGDDEATLRRLMHYGSTGIVSDSEYVRKKLIQDKKWNILGQSYGGHIVHRYLTQAPQSVNAGFSHANILQTDGYERIKNRIASQIRVLKVYLERFPEDREKLVQLREFLNKDRCYMDPYDKDRENKACGHELLDTFNGMLGFSDSWMELHKWLGIMVKDAVVDNEEVGRYMSAFYFSENNDNPLNVKHVASSVIAWVDRNVPSMNIDVCLRVKSDLEKLIDFEKEALAHECSSSLQEESPTDEDRNYKSPRRLRIEQLPQMHMNFENLLKALTENKDLKLNLYSGQLDTYVPVENFREELIHVRALPNVNYTHFNGTGHDGFYAEPKVWSDLLKASIGQ